MLGDDKKAIFMAASQATKAVEFLQSLRPRYSDAASQNNMLESRVRVRHGVRILLMGPPDHLMSV